MFRTSDESSGPALSRHDRWLVAASIGLIILGTSPIFFSWQPFPTLAFFNQFPGWRQAGRVFLCLAIAGAILLVRWIDPEKGPAKTMRYAGFVLLAALLTEHHFHTVDVLRMNWQIDQYGAMMSHSLDPPHQYRFLPQGTLWWMVLCDGDFGFSYVAYRFFFTFLVCQAIYSLAREFLPPRDAVIVVLGYGIFYPLSTRYYFGNLLDPMSHAVMLAALTCCWRRQFWPLFWLLVLGMFIKETMLVIAPCYYLFNPEGFRSRVYQTMSRVVLLGVAGMAAFFACRLPFHFQYNFGTLNGTLELMIYSNLGMARGQARHSVPLFQRYLHPVLFIFMWLPLVVWRRKLLPSPLFWTAIYIAAVSYVTSLLFSWNHESRNFIPALVLLMVCTMVVLNGLLAPPFDRIEEQAKAEVAAS
jgi:hypothetical protein